jgi:hypothetical protein
MEADANFKLSSATTPRQVLVDVWPNTAAIELSTFDKSQSAATKVKSMTKPSPGLVFLTCVQVCNASCARRTSLQTAR